MTSVTKAIIENGVSQKKLDGIINNTRIMANSKKSLSIQEKAKLFKSTLFQATAIDLGSKFSDRDLQKALDYHTYSAINARFAANILTEFVTEKFVKNEPITLSSWRRFSYDITGGKSVILLRGIIDKIPYLSEETKLGVIEAENQLGKLTTKMKKTSSKEINPIDKTYISDNKLPEVKSIVDVWKKYGNNPTDIEFETKILEDEFQQPFVFKR